MTFTSRFTRILDPRQYRMDDLLRRSYTPTTPFGSTGNCLWATSPQGWGFREGVHWVHKTQEGGIGPLTLAIRADGVEVVPADALYRPSYVTLNALDAESGLQVTEDKFITQDDVVISVISIRNPGEFHVDVEIDHAWGVPSGENRFVESITTYVYREAPPLDYLRQRIPGFAHRTLIFAVAFAPTMEEARQRIRRWTSDPNPVLTHAEEYQRWFTENIPLFDCTDPWVTKMWYHRWYVAKKNHSRVGAGLLQEDSFSEGRWNSGWYTATITYGAGHVLREARWLRNPEYARNYFRGFARCQREDGLYRSFYVDGIARPTGDEGKYTDWITAAVWDTHLVQPDTAFLREALPALRKNISYWQRHSWDNDGLLVVDNHWWTGMEWQPSFFFKANYKPAEGRDASSVQNPVKRTDLTSYQYANVRALAAVQRQLGQAEDAVATETLAETIRQAALAKMWDAQTGFFYDLLPGNDERIFTAKTIAAFYPYYAGLPSQAEYAQAWSHLTNPDEFWPAYPPASTAQDSPAYSQDPEMQGRPLTVCYWNGPTWPHATSLVISGLARSLRELGEEAHPVGSRQTLLTLLTSFTQAQFETKDYDRPHTGEFYRGDTADWQTPERDYLHSTYADLILTGLIGIVPRADEVLELHPLLPSPSEGGWSHFCVENVPYHDRLITIVWDDPEDPVDHYDDGSKGFVVYVDGRRVHQQPGLDPVTIPLG